MKIFDLLQGLERLVGFTFVFSGVIKLLGVLEDTGAVFRKMAIANQGTEIEVLSQWMAANEAIIVPLVGLIMIGTGLTQIMLHTTSKYAALVQALMMICFVTFLHRGFPMVLFDGLYFLAFVIIYLQPRGKLQH